MDDPLRAPLSYSSDVDGDLYAVIDASLADLAGWKLETRAPGGEVDINPFKRGTHYGGPKSSNLIGYGERRDAWMAWAERFNPVVALISPDGRRIPLDVPRTVDNDDEGSDEAGETADAPTVPADQIAGFLARHRPPHCRWVEFRVPPHEQIGQHRHNAVLRTLFAELLDVWPAGSMLVINYGHEYAQAVAYSPALLTEIGPVTEDQLNRAVELGWMNPVHTPRDHSDFDSSRLWIDNPVREWHYPIDTIPEIAGFIAISVTAVHRVDPAAGYSVKIFHNHSDDDHEPSDPEPASMKVESTAAAETSTSVLAEEAVVFMPRRSPATVDETTPSRMALIHAYPDGRIAGAWTSQTDSAYEPGESDFHERGTWMISNYADRPWDELCSILSMRSPYIERWAAVRVVSDVTPADVLALAETSTDE